VRPDVVLAHPPARSANEAIKAAIAVRVCIPL
jgi:hypothetical protein